MKNYNHLTYRHICNFILFFEITNHFKCEKIDKSHFSYKNNCILLCYHFNRIGSMRLGFRLSKLILVVAVWAISLNGFSQKSYKIIPDESKFLVTGTSTLHDWHMKVEEMICNVVADVTENNKISISNIDFKCATNSLKSDNSLMDKKAFEALQTDRYKTISFSANTNTTVAIANGVFTGSLLGELEISGIKKKVNIPFNAKINNNTVIITGELKIKFSDFEIKPPTAVMGTIKTGNELVLKYNLKFQ